MGLELEQSYIAQLREELADVAMRFNKLERLIHSEPVRISQSERELLIVQKETMKAYEAVLVLRLSRVTEINRGMAR